MTPLYAVLCLYAGAALFAGYLRARAWLDGCQEHARETYEPDNVSLAAATLGRQGALRRIANERRRINAKSDELRAELQARRG